MALMRLPRRVHQLQPVTQHGYDHDDDRQYQRPPEAALEVDVLRIRLVARRRHLGLERHAADRTVAGLRLADLRMHRAGVNGRGTCAGRRRSRRRLARRALSMRVMIVRVPVMRSSAGSGVVLVGHQRSFMFSSVSRPLQWSRA